MTKPKDLPPIAWLREILHYDPVTGELTWKITKGGRKAGTRAGLIKPCGIVIVKLNSSDYRAHRLAWAIYYGETPPEVIDHMDQCQSNNAIANLRAATKSTNAMNYSTTKSNTGIRGITWVANRGYYQAKVHNLGLIRGKSFFVTRYGSQEAAFRAAQSWVALTKTELHKEFACHGAA